MQQSNPIARYRQQAPARPARAGTSIRSGALGLTLALAVVAGLAATTSTAEAQGRSAVPSQGAAAGGPSPEALAEQRRVVLRFLTANDFPPFNVVDDEGQLTGLNVDLARAICLELQTACEINALPWGELLNALSRRRADAVIAGHAITPAHMRKVDFTDRYLHTPARFAGRRNGPRLEYTPEGLDGRRIGVARDTAHEAFLRRFFADSRIERFDTQERAREALIAGSLDAIFDDGISLTFWVSGTLSRECCELKGGPFLEPLYFGEGLAIAVAKGDHAMAALLNDALARVRGSGRLDELLQRYFPGRLY